MGENLIEYNGEKHTLSEWAEIMNMNKSTLRNRLRLMPIEKAMHRGRLSSARPSKIWEMDGERHTMTEWAQIYGINESTVRNRIDCGWSFRRALTTPIGFVKKYTYNGKEYTLKELSEICGISPETLRSRIKKNGSVEEAMSKPPPKRRKNAGYCDKRVRCTRYDCLYQDGSGVCFLDFKSHEVCGDSYRDAYEYYYGNGNTMPPRIGKNKSITASNRRGMSIKNGTLQYCGSGSVYAYKTASQEAQPTDLWARDRKLLLSGSIPD